MALVQRIQQACGEHDGCMLIDCVTTEDVIHHETGDVIHPAETVVWRSHMDDGIHAEHRLNPQHPAEDHRGAKPKPVKVTPWCTECKAHPAAAVSAS